MSAPPGSRNDLFVASNDWTRNPRPSVDDYTTLDRVVIIPPDDHQLGDLLIAAARREQADDAIRTLLRHRAAD